MLRIEIPYKPHQAQQIFHDCTARFRVLACGTKLGKTKGCVHEALRFAVSNPKTIVWWVAPFYGQAKIGWRRLTNDCPRQLVAAENKQELTLRFINDSLIQFKSAEIPDHLRGEDVDLVVVDEAARVSEDSWHSIQTTLTKTKGRGVFISTPKGKNWFYQIFKQGLEDKSGEYRSFTFPTSANPYVDPAEIEKARLRLPKAQFEQDYLAKFKDDFGSAFDSDSIEKSIDETIGLTPIEADVYWVGMDVGRHRDATVLTAMNEQGCVRGFKRIEPESADWNKIYDEAELFTRHYNDGIIVLDSNGIGDPVYDELTKRGLAVEPIQISSNQAKNALIHKLAMRLEQGKIKMPNIEVLVKELQEFGYKISETSGLMRYSAPANKHDDCVIALALATWFAAEESEIQVGIVNKMM